MAKQEQGTAATVGVMGGRQRAATFTPLFRNEPSEEERAAVSEGVIKEKAAVKELISDALFNLPSLGHNFGFCFLLVWCRIVYESSGHHVRYPGHFVL